MRFQGVDCSAFLRGMGWYLRFTMADGRYVPIFLSTGRKPSFGHGLKPGYRSICGGSSPFLPFTPTDDHLGLLPLLNLSAMNLGTRPE